MVSEAAIAIEVCLPRRQPRFAKVSCSCIRLNHPQQRARFRKDITGDSFNFGLIFTLYGGDESQWNWCCGKHDV